MPRLSSQDALILVDVQNDFCPGGALPVEDCDCVVPVLNRWIEAAERGGARIVASRDWHPPAHVSFREQGGEWPEHCVQHTPGAEFRPDLALPHDARIVSKGTDVNHDSYSPFQATGLADELQRDGVRRVWIGGLALDVCVRATALDAVDAGFEVHLIVQGASPVHEAGGRQAVAEMRQAGVAIEPEDAHA